MSPTELSMRHLRKDGWLVDVCERWVPNPAHPGGGQRRDLFGLVDLVAIRGTQTLGVQTTTAPNVSAHLLKMTDDEHRSRLADLFVAGWTIVVHGWAKQTKEGHICKHGKGAHCGCRYVLRRNIDMGVAV